jgi:hypothetical protein
MHRRKSFLNLWVVAALLLLFVSQGRAAAAPNSVSALTFATGESNGAPQDASDRFNVGTDQIYSFFDFSSIGPDDPITGTWYQGARVLLTQSNTLNDIFKGGPPDSGTVWFSAKINGGFAPGDYRLEIRVNDQVMQTGEFRVAPRKGEALIANTVFSGQVNDTGDKLRYPIDVQTQFAESTQQVYAVFDHFEMDAAKSWGWRLSREGVALDGQQDQPWDGQAEGTYALPLRLPGNPGVYDLDLYLNGQWVDAESFIVGSPPIPTDRLIQTDDFSDPSSGWGTARIGASSVRYLGGRYVLTAVGDAPVWGTSGKEIDNGVAEIRAQLTNVPSSVNAQSSWGSYGYFGLVARWQDKDNYYVFSVSPSGEYAIYHLLNGNLVWDTRWTQALRDVIPPGLQDHTLRLQANGQILRFYVDGRLVGVVPEALWDRGQTGAIAGPMTGVKQVTAAFQDFSEWSLPAANSSNGNSR